MNCGVFTIKPEGSLLHVSEDLVRLISVDHGESTGVDTRIEGEVSNLGDGCIDSLDLQSGVQAARTGVSQNAEVNHPWFAVERDVEPSRGSVHGVVDLREVEHHVVAHARSPGIVLGASEQLGGFHHRHGRLVGRGPSGYRLRRVDRRPGHILARPDTIEPVVRVPGHTIDVISILHV